MVPTLITATNQAMERRRFVAVGSFSNTTSTGSASARPSGAAVTRLWEQPILRPYKNGCATGSGGIADS